MDNLILDPEALNSAASIIEGYCAKQREVINEYYNNIMTLRSEWVDDETFGDMVRELDLLRSAALDSIDGIYRTYPDTFRRLANMIRSRPAMSGGAPVSTSSGASEGGMPTEASGGVGASPTGQELRRATATERKKGNLFISKSRKPETDTKDTTEAEEYRAWLASKPITEANVDMGDDRDGSCFWGVNGARYSKTKELLIERQGNNGKNHIVKGRKGKLAEEFCGTCGLASLANVMRQLGFENVTEHDIVTLATEGCDGKPLCELPRYNFFGQLVQTGGGTTNKNITDLAEKAGLEAKVSPRLSIDDIDGTLKRGGAVMMSVVSSDLGKGQINRTKPQRTDHWVTVMGVYRNSYTGAIEGITLQDTGGHAGSPTVTLSVEEFNAMREKSNDFAGVSFFRRDS